MARAITIKSQLGQKLLFARMTANEELGRLFTFQVQTYSKDEGVDLRALLGTSMTVTITLDSGLQRSFNGIVAEAWQNDFETLKNERYAAYEFLLVPKPWLTTRKADCRIYKNLSVPDIVKKVLQEAGYSDLRPSLRGSYPVREYCVQYRESYFNFISRLMEQEGIYYYFTHDESTHTMVLADGLDAHQKIKPNPELEYRPVAERKLTKDWSVTEFTQNRSIETNKYQLTDYDPLKPRASLLVTELARNPDQNHSVSGLSAFDYPGDYDATADGSRYAEVRVESLNAAHFIHTGVSDAVTLATGALFKLKGFPRKELDQEYLVTRATTRLEASAYASGGTAEDSFGLNFHAISTKQPFRTLQTTARPVIAGLQTAVVCGSQDAEDIVVDKYSRVQVIFHWNKPNKENHDVSCPVRVSTPWAGKQWGAIHIPRVGQEVVVSFLEGDPDRPLIVGSVYNADNMPPYDLPANMTQSGIKSRSHKGGGTANFNEIRFEDKKGSEELFLHAEKDMREEVENDHLVEIGHDETEHIAHDRKHTIDNDEVFTIKNDRTHDVTGEEKVTIGKNRKHTVGEGETIDIGKASAITIGEDSTVTVGKTYVLDVADEITIKTGSASINMKKDGTITIKGKDITIDGSMNVNGKAGMNMSLKAGMNMAIKGDVGLAAEGGAKAEVKGAMLDLSGSAMAKLKGAITMIG